MGKLTTRDIQARLHHVHVTAEHIAEGVRGDAQQCAIAVALEGGLLDDGEVIAVNHKYIVVGSYTYGQVWHALTPATAAEFIEEFDIAEDDHDVDLLRKQAEAGELEWDLRWHEGAPEL